MIQERQVQKTLSLAADKAILIVDGLSTIAIEVTGTFVGTAVFEYTVNGTDWYALTVYDVASGVPSTQTTTTGKWLADVAGFLSVRVRCSAYTSGSIVVNARATSLGLNFNKGFSAFSITTQTTTTVKSGAGFLRAIEIPTPVANATVKIYDNTAASGTVLLDTITFPAALLSSGPISLILDKSFSTGLTIVTAGATMSVSGSYR